MVRASLLVFVVLVATAAAPAAASRQPLFDEAELLSGRSLALAPPAAPVVVPTREEAFALDAEMQAFVAPLMAVRVPRLRMLELAEAMEKRGMFSLEYAEVTRTASETFHGRQGNCLSFTMLFVALARAADLRVSFQTRDVPPSWAYDGAVVIANHINAAVRTGSGVETIVDFNIRPYEGRKGLRQVTDAYALGLFYTNLGAEALLRNEHAAALVYFREAATVHSDLAGLWSNLGVLYARNGKHEHAEAAYLRALEIDGSEPSALANLALVYEALGETELATQYAERVQSYRERNPYYHFASAARAYEQQQFETALQSIRKAVRLKPDEHEFYSLRGQVQTALGKSREATQSFDRARQYEQAEAQGLVELGGLALR